MRLATLTSFLLLLFACNKQPLTDVTTEMVGTWTHYTNETDHHVLYIEPDGTGKLEWYNHNGLHQDTKIREWFIKDNRMYFGKVTFNGEFYDIEQFPVTAGSAFANYYDSIPAGSRYCILNDVYYVELP